MNDQSKATPLYEGAQGTFVEAIWSGKNTSGFRPHGRNVLVRCDTYSPISSGGVHIPDDLIERRSASADTGCLYALGPDALRLYEDGTVWTGHKPEVGERIFFQRHAGTPARGRDGAMYRFMDYRNIDGGLDPDWEEGVA